MRLLKLSGDGEFSFTKDILDENEIPPYAILSHTWQEDQEVTFDEFLNDESKKKAGYKKLQFCARQAKRDGLEHFWVDTCCINKSNSTELQEAINSMFRWYQKATKCYVYLSDVRTDSENETGSSLQYSEPAFRQSRWFTRGWTLQELLAPVDVEFFDCEEQLLGNKNELRGVISDITNISPDVLAGQDLKRCSVAQRMSWAANRSTTRPEDVAYSLMGIFDIDMPLLYGEGQEKAFYRLQEEIMKRSDDHSIFAWELPRRYAVHGLLAPSPAAFKNSQHIIYRTTPGRRAPYGLTNRGLQMNLSIAEHLWNGLYAAALDCVDQRTGTQLGIYLKQIGENRFVRTRLDQLPKLGLDCRIKGFKPFECKTFYIPQVTLASYRPPHKFRTSPKAVPRIVDSGLPRPSIKIAKAIIAALGICRGSRAGRVTIQLSLRPR
jgi:hypothetical protein